jgi:hypothetical protein
MTLQTVGVGAIKKLDAGNGGIAVGIVLLCGVELEICPLTREVSMYEI